VLSAAILHGPPAGEKMADRPASGECQPSENSHIAMFGVCHYLVAVDYVCGSANRLNEFQECRAEFSVG